MLCRSEARKIEQKELVMEGGVVGIGINLVRPSLMVMKPSCACSDSCSTAFAQSYWSPIHNASPVLRHLSMFCPRAHHFSSLIKGCTVGIAGICCYRYGVTVIVCICRITAVADLSSISTPCYNKVHMCMWRIGMVAMDP